MPSRCNWVEDDALSVAYHDHEWGVAQRSERHLFEMLTLEGAQAGLSWMTILRKREGYRAAFADFDINAVAGFSHNDVQRLLGDVSIVRNRGKIEATIGNARSIIALGESGVGFSEWLWSFVDGQPIVNAWQNAEQIPAHTPASTAMGRALKRKGFKFCGPTICYSLMQAVGMVNDHTVDCFRWQCCSKTTA